jgi:glycosyltransferase involved in cell wall biosynthesis
MTAPGDAALEVALDVSAVPERPAGAGRYVVELARALARRPDCGLTVVARRDDSRRWAQIAPGQRVSGVAPAHRLSRLVYEQARLGSVVSAMAGPAVRVHHGPHYTMPRRSRLPCVVTVHDMTFFDHPEWHERSKVAWFRAATRYSARHAAVIICVSGATAERLQSVLAPRCPVLVVPHGVDGARFGADEPRPGLDSEVVQHLGLDRPYLLHLGTMEPRKGIVDLVKAFDLLARDRPELDLVLAGGLGWGGRPIAQSIAASSWQGRIRRLGYVPDEAVAALLRRARAVVYPSIEEGFGLPALEALACGAPLVTTSGTSMAEVAGESALLAPPGQPAALAEAISAAIAEDGSGAAARRRARGLEIAAQHTWEACAEGHMAAYRLASDKR